MAEDTDEEILSEAKKRFERCVAYESAWRDHARFDTKFANADPLNGWAWDANVLQDRGGRPCLSYNQIRQHNLQIINDARQNKAQIKVSPTGGRASYEAAQVFSGIIRRIEYQSKAVDAYSTASYHQVESGMGYVRVDTDYVSPDSFDLDLFIRRVPDPKTIYMDPDCEQYDKSDAKFAFIFEDIPRDRYEEEHGEADSPAPATLDRTDGWNDKDHVRIAEYWRKTMTAGKIHQLRDGLIINDGEIPKDLRDDVMRLVVKTRDVQTPEIEWFKLSGHKIIDREKWLGKYIPIVPWVGEETVIDGVMDRKGHTRAMIDAQRIYNYWAPLSLHTPLPTPDGWTTMGQVEAGDRLLDEAGSPTVVVGTSPIYLRRECFRVEFDDGSHIIADAGHPWWVEERGKAIAGGWQWTDRQVTTKDLTPGQHFIHMPRPLDLPNAELPLDPYLLGMWLGNGSTTAPSITNNEQDLDETRRYLAEAGYRLSPVRPQSGAGTFTVYDVKDRLRGLGVLGNKHIPPMYLRASSEQRWALLQGLMDTDGSANRRLHTCEFTTSLPYLSSGFAELLSSLGLKTTHIRRAATRRKMPGGEYSDILAHDQFTFSAPPDVQVFRLGRKRSVQQKPRITHWRRTRRFRIKALVPVPSEPVKCVAVDAPSHLFLAGRSMVPTHNSSAVEQVALQTKTPYVARADAIEGREEQWASANIKNYSVLIHNALDEQGNPIPPPQRNDPPTMAQAYIQGMTIARQDLMAVSGQYQAELGAPGNERSGVAIQQRQRQGDTATYHYIDNQAKGIRQVGRILLDLIPKIYDVRRVVMTLGEDGSESKVVVAPDAPEAHQQIAQAPDGQPMPVQPGQAQQQTEDPDRPDPMIIFNPNVGTYDVVEADVGPSYGTQRQEAANAFSQIMQQNPAAFQIVGDFWAQNSDFPGADELAERLKRGIPPQYKAGPDPQVAAIAQQAQQQGDHAKQLLQQADAEIASLKAQLVHQTEQAKDKSQELEIKAYDSETKRLDVVGGIDPLALQLVVRNLVRDMLQTELHPVLQQHAANEGALQASMLPPEPVEAPVGP